jgi:CheY-like chemotaxis protein
MGGVFLASSRPEHEDGTFIIFTAELSATDTARVEAEGQKWLAIAAQQAGPGLISAARSLSGGQKHSFVIPHIGRIPMKWPSQKLYSTREDNLRPAVQQFYSTHYRRLLSTDMLSNEMQLTAAAIVDFNPATVQMLTRIVQETGRRALVFETGVQAVAAWQRRSPSMIECDVLLLRVDLPQLSGPTVAHMLLQQRFTGKIVLYHDPDQPVQPVNAKLDVLPQRWNAEDVLRRLSRRNRTAEVLAQDKVVLPGLRTPYG